MHKTALVCKIVNTILRYSKFEVEMTDGSAYTALYCCGLQVYRFTCDTPIDICLTELLAALRESCAQAAEKRVWMQVTWGICQRRARGELAGD